MVNKMWVSLMVSFTLFSWNSADENPFTMQYIEGDRAMLNCSDEYSETIQIATVLYNYSTCSHGDKYGIQNLCDGHTTCNFDVTNSNVGSSCGADGKAALQVSYNCKRNGGWSKGTRNSSCSGTCGEGIQLYTRSCTNPSPNEIGTSCVGESYYQEVCINNNTKCDHTNIANVNTELSWTCPGGYIQVNNAIWQKSGTTLLFDVLTQMKNRCDNKASCGFTLNDANLGVSCDGNCSVLIYSYECVNVHWNSWEPWSNCSGSCVTGIQTRTRSCNSRVPAIQCEGLSTKTKDCDETDCSHCGDQKLYDRHNSSSQINTDSSAGTGYLLLDPVNAVHCCGHITMWYYIPVKTGTITFSVWRKTDVNRYKVVETNIVVVTDSDLNNQTTYNVPENERILINTGDIIGWHDGGHNIIGYYNCTPSKKSCPTTTLWNNMSSTNAGDEINIESLPQQSSRIYTMSYTSTVKSIFGMTPDKLTIGDHTSVNSEVMNIQIKEVGDVFQKMELDNDNEYFYFDTRLRSIFVKKELPQNRTIHTYVLSVQDQCYNTATFNITIVTENTPPMIDDLSGNLTFNPININPNLTMFTVEDPSDNVTCMINKTLPHTDMFILILHGNNGSLILSENSSIDVNTNSEYVIIISCTDGADTTFFNLTLPFTILFTTKGPAVTDKLDTESDSIPIIIGASIGVLFLLVVIIVVCVRKRQHKNNDKNSENKKTLYLSYIDDSSDGVTPNRNSMPKGSDAIPHNNCENAEVDVAIDDSSDGATPNRYSMTNGFDAISDDDIGYAEVRKGENAGITILKARNVEKQPSKSVRF